MFQFYYKNKKGIKRYYIPIHMSHNIEKIFYINLDKRTDRREEIESDLKKYGLEAERYSAVHTPNAGIVGCGYSHLNVLKLAKERGYKNVLILEDDFEFTVSPEEFEESLNQFFETTPNSSGDRRSPTELVVGGVNAPLPDYDVCMLAYIVQEAAEIPGNTVVGRVLNGQTAAGYIVNVKYLDVLIELYEWAIPLLEQTNEHWNYANDHVWKRLQPKDNWVYMLKRLGKQRDSYSDNKMCYVTPNT